MAITMLMLVMMMGVDAGVNAGGAAGGASGTKRAKSAMSGDDESAAGAAGGALDTKRAKGAVSDDATEWPAPGDKGYGTMHKTFDKHWVDCDLKIRQHGMFYPWWRMVRPYVLAGIKDTDEDRPEDQDWNSYVVELRLQHIEKARERIRNPTEDLIKLDALSYYRHGSFGRSFPNWEHPDDVADDVADETDCP